MKEEQAVLDFFEKPENLPLGLSVATQMDRLREQMNSQLWQDFQNKLVETFDDLTPEWHIEAIEDRNAADVLMGLQCKLKQPQTQGLIPMIEQQFLGGSWRIFFGLMWQTAATPEQLALPAVTALKQNLVATGFKSNETFLAWQWTRHYPRHRHFLLTYAQQAETLMVELTALFSTLSLDQYKSISLANAALNRVPRTLTISLDQLRSKRTH
ncbi:MAG: hypothetical protein R8K48_06995 [Gallionella sp.]